MSSAFRKATYSPAACATPRYEERGIPGVRPPDAVVTRSDLIAGSVVERDL
jgi:hypothetical protein